jgi:hypothetical protein
MEESISKRKHYKKPREDTKPPSRPKTPHSKLKPTGGW